MNRGLDLAVGHTNTHEITDVEVDLIEIRDTERPPGLIDVGRTLSTVPNQSV